MPRITDALNAVVDAWERLRGGRNYSPDEIERWLAEDMKPALDEARRALGRKIPKS